MKLLDAQHEKFSLRTEMLRGEVTQCVNSTTYLWWNTAAGIGAFVVLPSAAGMFLRWAWNGACNPESMRRAGIVASWYKPDYQDRLGNVYYEKMNMNEEGATTLRPHWWFGLFCGMPVVTLLLSAWGALWAYRSADLKKQAQIVAEAQVLEKQDLEKHKIMWDGLRMSVDAVRYHYDLVVRLVRGREMHRRKAIHDLGKSLWWTPRATSLRSSASATRSDLTIMPGFCTPSKM